MGMQKVFMKLRLCVLNWRWKIAKSFQYNAKNDLVVNQCINQNIKYLETMRKPVKPVKALLKYRNIGEA